MTKTELQILGNQTAIMHALQVIAMGRPEAVNELVEPFIERTKRLMQDAKAGGITRFFR